MKPIIFTRISDMEYYKGITPTDKPRNGGSHVDETGEAHEAFNFDAIEFNGEKICLGFAMLIGNSSQTNLQIRLESMIGGKHLKKEQYVDGVTVVWCAKDPFENHIRVVGFYKNATVYRHTQEMEFLDENNELCYIQNYNFVAKEENCVLLPYGERNKNKWRVPTSGKNGATFGFGRSSIWYANSNGENPKEDKFVEYILENIDAYTGKNLMEE